MNQMPYLFKKLNQFHSQQGFTLIEVLIAIVIILIVAVALLGASSTSSKILINANADETARDYAQAQMEDIQKQPFGSTYAVLSNVSSDVYIEILPPIDINPGNEQKIIVTVTQAGQTFTLEGYKIKGY